MSKTFKTGDAVRLSHATGIPIRYTGRLGHVVGRQRRGKSFRYEIDLGSRRATPLVVAARNLTLA